MTTPERSLPVAAQATVLEDVIHNALGWLIPLTFILVLTTGPLSAHFGRGSGLGWVQLLDDALFFGFAAVVVVMSLLLRRLYLSHYVFWLALFAFVGIISSILGQVPLRIAFLGMLLALKPLVLLIVYQSAPLNDRAARTTLRCLEFIFAAVIISAVLYTVIVEKGFGFNPLPGYSAGGPSRIGLVPARSFFVHPSPFSSVLTVTGLYFFSNYLLTGRRRSLALFMLATIGVILALRMKALFLLPVAASSVFILIRLRVSNWRINIYHLLAGAIVLFVSLLAIAISAYILRDILLERLTGGVNNVRNALLLASLHINVDTFGLGAGFGMFGSSVSVSYHYSDLYHTYGISNMWRATPDDPQFITDQWWAWFLGEVGIIGTTIFVFALWFVMKNLAKIAQTWRDENPSLATLSYTAWGSLVYGIASGYAGVYLTSPPTGYYIMSLAGLAYAIHRALRDSYSTHQVTVRNVPSDRE